MKNTVYFAALASISALSLIVKQAKADMSLTGAGVADGFTLTTFASGFPTSNSIGPFGVAFTTTGGVMTTDGPGNIRLFPTDTDGQVAGSAPVATNLGIGNAKSLAQNGNIIYNAEGSGTVDQLNQDGTINRTVASGISGVPNGLLFNPSTNHLLIATSLNNLISDINPATGSVTPFLSVAGPDGISLSPGGTTLYVASQGSSILGFNTTTKSQVFSASIATVDGIALGTGSLAGDIFGNTNDGRVVEVNLATGIQTVIAAGGSRGDFVTVDPHNGSLLLTQTDSILRLSGGVFAVPHSIISLTATAPSLYGSQITNGAATNQGSFTSGANQLNVSGSNGSYKASQVTGINAGSGGTTNYVSATGFNPATDREIFGLDVLIGGAQATPTQIETLVGDINSSNSYGYGSSIASANDPTDGAFSSLSPATPYNICNCLAP